MVGTTISHREFSTHVPGELAFAVSLGGALLSTIIFMQAHVGNWSFFAVVPSLTTLLLLRSFALKASRESKGPLSP